MDLNQLFYTTEALLQEECEWENEGLSKSEYLDSCL